MNVASLELCRELYELSGWDTGPDSYWWHTQGTFGTYAQLPDLVDLIEESWKKQCPAYTVGYLRRKLPLNTELASDTDNSVDGTWYAKLRNADRKVTKSDKAGNLEFADTPENALCRLAIELFKQGILTKEVK